VRAASAGSRVSVVDPTRAIANAAARRGRVLAASATDIRGAEGSFDPKRRCLDLGHARSRVQAARALVARRGKRCTADRIASGTGERACLPQAWYLKLNVTTTLVDCVDFRSNQSE
jgi:hypothetical protein